MAFESQPKLLMSLDPQTHRKIAVELFNQTWTLMEKGDRTPAETDALIHGAHASRYHWGLVGNATNLSVGEWQIARVYAVLQRAEPALHHARRCLEFSEQGGVAPFYVAYAHEAMARAYSLTKDPLATDHLVKARQLAESIAEAEERQALLADLATIQAG
jgi:hypothetical protein